MLQQDTKNVELSPVGSQGKSVAETGKELLRYTPSKRMFMEINFHKVEALKTKDVRCVKSNSKIGKKKRPKDKLKLFKLDKHLWDPAMQIPQLGKSAKYFKKKYKLAANDAEMSGIQISGSNITRNETHKVLPCRQPKPLEYTFDILCLTGNASSPPLEKRSEDDNASAENDLLTISSSSQEVVPVSKADLTNRSYLGDLIVLETPKPSKPKVCHFDGQLSESLSNMHDTLGKATNPSPKTLSLNLLMNTPAVPYSADVEGCQQRVLEALKPFKPSFRHFDGQLSEPSTDKLDTLDKDSNPDIQRVIDSAGPSSTEESAEEYVHMQANSEVDILGYVSTGELEQNSDGSGTTLMQDGNVRVSAEENSAFEHDDQYQPNDSELSKGLCNSNGQGDEVCSPMAFYDVPEVDSPSTAKIEKQQILISQHPRQMLVDQLNKYPFPKVVRENVQVRIRRRAFSLDDGLMASIQCIPLDMVDPGCQSEVGKARDVVHGETPGPQNSGLHVSSQKLSVPTEDPEHSFSAQKEKIDNADYSTICSCSDDIVSNDLSECPTGPAESIEDSSINDYSDSNSSIPTAADKQLISEGESDAVSPVEVTYVNVSEGESNSGVPENSLALSEACKYESYNIEDPKIVHDSGLAPGNITATQHHMTSPPTTSFISAGQVCEIPVENQSSEPSSSDLDTPLDSSVTPEEEASVGTAENAGTLFINSTVDGSDYKNILPQNILEQTPVLSSSDEKKLPEGVAPVKITHLGKLEADGNENSGLACQETSFILGTGLASPELSNSNVEESDLHRDSELYSDHTLINISSQTENQSTRESSGGVAESITTPTKDIATPRGVSSRFEDSYNETSFGDQSCVTPLAHWVLPPGKKFRRSLAIIRNLDECPSAYSRRGRHYKISVEEVIKLQGNNAEARTPVQTLRKRLSMRRSSWMRKTTPPTIRRSTFIWSPKITDRGTLYETPHPRKSIYSTPLQQNLARRMSVRISPMLGPRRSVRSPLNQNCSPASPGQYTIRDLILTICKQSEPCSFSDILSEESYEAGCKLGEGVFGEVFSINRNGQNTVLKIIPIEGQQLVNGEKQKTYQEVLSELVIAKVLDEMRYEGSDKSNITSGFAELLATSLVQDSYPETLLQFWEEFDQKNGSDNDNPRMFDEEQLFIVMEQGNGGKDLESYAFSSAKQSLSIFKQIAFCLAVAEMSVEFEHRDLHWGNVLVSKTTEKHILYTLNGTQYSVASNGVKCTIIDYTLSRIKYINQFPIYNDIGKDPEMFIATGDYQFDIYRFMKEDVEDDWSRFVPKTNARWLHYLLDKMLTKVKYQRKTAKVHKDSFKVLEEIGEWIEDCGSALSVALRLVELKN